MLSIENTIAAQESEPGNANVKVVIRIRPLNEAENSEKHYTVTEAISDHMLVFDPKINPAPGFLNANRRDITRRRFKDLKYAFDYVFGPSATNKAVFEQTTKGIVSGVLNGYNCSVFAYGATGAGKTHTMLGNEREPGVIYHTMIDLYKRINEQKDEKLFDVAVSYSEVYNEQVRDLLIPNGNLPIREDKNIGVIIAGLSLHKPKTADELLHMLQFGNKNRTQHPTDANAESSRSHAVFQVFVNQREKSANVSTEVKMAKMCLVDLAGSERANHTTNRGDRFREGANINRSLLALGNVINALADNKFKGHIPYRDSKLTRLLKDSLGGNCQTVMIAAVSPSSRSFEDTYNTLRYADRAKHIRADLKKNVMSVDLHIANYKKYVQELEKENQELRKIKQKLTESLEKGDLGNVTVVSPIIRQYQERLKDLFKTRREMRRAQMESEGAKRELKWKVIRKERAVKRVQMLTASQAVISKHRRVIERMKKRIAKEDSSLTEAAHRIHEHDAAIYSTYSSISSSLADGKQTPEVLELNARIHAVESNLYDSHMYLAFVKKMARAQELQAVGNEKLISCLIQLVKKQHDILDSQDLLNLDLKEKFEQCCCLVEERGVAWNSPGPPQDGSSTHWSGKDDDEEISISEIIDIHIPKLQIQALRVDTPTKPRGDTFSHVKQQPQRVVKPMSAVKPASRSQQNGQSYENGERNVKTAFGSNLNNEDASSHPVSNASSHPVSNVDVTQNRMVNPSTTKVDGTSQPMEKSSIGRSAHEMTSMSGTSFEDNTLVPTESVSGEKVVGTQGSMKETMASAGPSSSLPNIGTVPLAKICLFGKCDFRQVSDTASQNSSTDNVNETFQVLTPALLNTPCIDKHLPKGSAMTPSQLLSDMNKPKLIPIEQLIQKRKSENVIEESLSKSPNPKDARTELSTKMSPVSRHNLRSPGSTFSNNSWTQRSDKDEKSNSRRASSDQVYRQSKCRTPTQITNKANSNSPLIFNRQSPTANKPLSGSNGVAAQKSNIPETILSKDKWKPAGGHCINANNVNSFSTSPRTYADVVKSPVVSQSLSPISVVKPILNNWVGEPMEGGIKTPNFNPCIQSIKSSLLQNKIDWSELLAAKPAGDTIKVRMPLRSLSTNTNVEVPLQLSEQAPSLDCTTEVNGYKLRCNNLKSRRMNRELSSNPYSIHGRKVKPSLSQEFPVDSDQSEPSDNSCPSYMQPTFARAQKMLGLGADKPVRREANNPLSRRTVTNRHPQQPLLSAQNKSNNSSYMGWRL